MKKSKRKLVIAAWVMLCVAIVTFLILSIPNIEGKTWVLSYAQQKEAPYLIVAHGKDYDVSTIKDPIFTNSKQVELIFETKNGKLLLTDKTNGKTYEGSYKISSVDGGRFQSFNGATYTVVIDGLKGTAKVSSGINRTLFVYIDGYSLNFDVE